MHLAKKNMQARLPDTPPSSPSSRTASDAGKLALVLEKLGVSSKGHPGEDHSRGSEKDHEQARRNEPGKRKKTTIEGKDQVDSFFDTLSGLPSESDISLFSYATAETRLYDEADEGIDSHRLLLHSEQHVADSDVESVARGSSIGQRPSTDSGHHEPELLTDSICSDDSKAMYRSYDPGSVNEPEWASPATKAWVEEKLLAKKNKGLLFNLKDREEVRKVDVMRRWDEDRRELKELEKREFLFLVMLCWALPAEATLGVRKELGHSADICHVKSL
jgi:Zn-finger nucleic acid-binding protein